MAIKIFMTGSTGFVGKNLVDYLSPNNEIYSSKKHDFLSVSCDVIIHLAGIAHDLKRVTHPNDYYKINTELTKEIFNQFLASDSTVFIFLSSVKAATDDLRDELFEDYTPNPQTHYGKSKLLAEDYILSKSLPTSKRVYILRPCMIHGKGNKGNFNLLYKLVISNLPWPLTLFNNKRSYCSVTNLNFIINELIERSDIPSGIYNVADDEPISTNELVKLISTTEGKNTRFLKVPISIIKLFAKLGDVFRLPFNSENLSKLTSSFVVSNSKLINAIGKSLPLSTRQGVILTIKSFKI